MIKKAANRTEEFGAVSRGQTFYYDPEKLKLVTNPSHPLFDERVYLPLDEGMILSIMAYGVGEPIVCRKNGEDKDGVAVIEVVDGRQRVRCSIEANARLVAAGKEPIRIPAVIRRSGEQDAIGAMITLNEVRTVDNIVVRAKKLSRFLQTGHSEDEAQIAYGVNQRGLKHLLAVASLAPEVQDKLQAGQMTFAAAMELSQLPQDQQREISGVALHSIEEAEPDDIGGVARQAQETPELSTKLKAESPRLTAAAVRRASGRDKKTTGKTRKSRPAKLLVAMIKTVQKGGVRGSASFKEGLVAALKYAIGDDSAINLSE